MCTSDWNTGVVCWGSVVNKSSRQDGEIDLEWFAQGHTDYRCERVTPHTDQCKSMQPPVVPVPEVVNAFAMP